MAAGRVPQSKTIKLTTLPPRHATNYELVMITRQALAMPVLRGIMKAPFSPAFDNRPLDRLLQMFGTVHGDGVDFNATGSTYFKEERAYKDELVAAYRSMLQPLLERTGSDSGAAIHTAFHSLLAHEKLPSHPTKIQNLVGWQHTDTFAKLNSDMAERAGGLIRDLLRGPGDVFARLDRFYPGLIEALQTVKKGGHQSSARSFATLLLMLDDPFRFIFIRRDDFNVAAEIIGQQKLIGHGVTPSGDEYRQALQFAEMLRDNLAQAGCPPRDMIDVQGFLYVVAHAKQNATATMQEATGNPPAAAASAQVQTVPSFPEIVAHIRVAGLLIEERTLRRYHAALRARGFAVLAGLSGAGKTWLTRAYAEATGAHYRLCAVAPNWTGPEDLLGHFNPITCSFQPTHFTEFLQDAAQEWHTAARQKRTPRDYHLVLDEMNLARVEHYFARLLSAMEIRSQSADHCAEVALHPGHTALLTPNLRFVGTINVDETTHGFSDKVFDRAQLVEIEAPRALLAAHLGDAEHAPALLAVWEAVREVAPFAFRVADDVAAYLREAMAAGATWQEALDEQVLQKVLPKLRGNDARIGKALQDLQVTCKAMPLSLARAEQMAQRFQAYGFVSYF